MKKHYILEVGYGSTIKIWRDNWIPGIQGPPRAPIIAMNPSHVNQLIDSNTKTWRLEMLNVIFDHDIVSVITEIRIPIYGKYKLRWKPADNGKFSVKTAYKVILNDYLVKHPTKNNLNIAWNSFWKVRIPPRIQYFMWKCLHNCIPTKEWLARYTQYQDSVCCLCGKYSESVQQLFVDCEITENIYNGVNPTIYNSLFVDCCVVCLTLTPLKSR